MAKDWKDRSPHLGARGRAWAERRIPTVVRLVIAEEKFEQWKNDFLCHEADLIAWFVDHVDGYVRWFDDPEYRGSRWSHGKWLVILSRYDLINVLAEIEDAEGRRLRREEAARYPTLDAWLRAEAQGELEAPPVEDPHYAATLLHRGGGDTEATHRFVETKQRLQDRWPRACRTCGGQFTWKETRRKAVRCAACCARGRRTLVADPEGERAQAEGPAAEPASSNREG